MKGERTRAAIFRDLFPHMRATRNGRPAYEDAPPPVRAPVPMSEWLKRHEKGE